MTRPWLLLLFILLAAACPAGAQVLESIARIRALSPEDAARQLPVMIEAHVTYRDGGQPALLAHDGRDGIFVELPGGARPELQAGVRARIEGTTQPGGFLPIIRCERATVLPPVPVPFPVRMDPAELFSPALDCQWVEVPAVITGRESRRSIALLADISGWTIKLLLPVTADGDERAARLMQRHVLVRGVVGSVFNAKRQLTGRHFFVPSFDHLVVTDHEPPGEEAQLCATDEILRSDSTGRTRVLVRGVVTHATDEGVYLRDRAGGLFVRSVDATGLAPGSEIEAEGFGVVAPFRPVLRAIRLRVLGQASAPTPVPLRLSGGGLVGSQAELVAIDADLLGIRDGPGQATTLQCRVENWFFEAYLPGPAAGIRARPNDRVRLAGICELTTTGMLPFSNNVDGFRVHLRGPADVQVLAEAPWWTLERLLWALGMVGVLALLAFAWVALLRRRVADQTEIIRVQIERSAVKDERQRIARELHDTIEQELAGVSLQLRNARQRLVHAPEQAGSSLDLAERMLRHCRDEARSSIRDLRSVALEQKGLHGALQELLAPLAAEAGARFTCEIEGAPRGLPGPAEIHLLRIAQEAVANAARHASARLIEVRLAYQPEVVILEVRDDGGGFDPSAPAPRGHFGILGIQERANKLSATLVLESSPGTGTLVRVTVPDPAAPRAASPIA